jgi:hypothetical protein
MPTVWTCLPNTTLETLLLVRRWAVEPGHRDVEQAEIHGELSAVMDDVIEHHAAEHGAARFAEQLLAPQEQRPGLGVGAVVTGG